MDKITLLGSMIDTYTFEQEWNEEMNNVELFCYILLGWMREEVLFLFNIYLVDRVGIAICYSYIILFFGFFLIIIIINKYQVIRKGKERKGN